MSLIDIAGTINTILFGMVLIGQATQLRLFRYRKQVGLPVTTSISLNRYASGFIGIAAFLVYGAALDPINPYLVWPRLVSCLLGLWIVIEIIYDRRNTESYLAGIICGGVTAAGVGLLAFGRHLIPHSAEFGQGLILAATVLLTQGSIFQLREIYLRKTTGAVSWHYVFYTMVKDLSNCALGFAMGLATGWPILLMGVLSSILKLLNLVQFRIYGSEEPS